MAFLETIFYFLIVIGILVFIHELGHFIAARLMGMRAEIFALGIGPRLLGFNRVNGFTFGKLKDDIELGEITDYRLCAFPIGGYVKVAGMIDESMDKEFLNTEPKPWEYRSKPVWKRMVVITAGVIMNVILAIAIFYGVSLIKGKTLTETTTIGYVAPGSTAQSSGLKPSDKIIRINSVNVHNWEDVTKSLYIDNLGQGLTFEIQRSNRDTVINIPKDQVGLLTERNFGIFPEHLVPIVTMVVEGKPAATTGLKAEDIITKFGDEEIRNNEQLVSVIKSYANQTTRIYWLRDNREMSAEITVDSDSTIGVGISATYKGPVKEVSYNVFSAIPKAFSDTYYYGIEVFFGSMAKIFKGDIPFNKAIGGPVKIAQVSAQSAEGGLLSFLSFIALLSMSLAIINILPVPALDGGHFILLCYEAVTRKPVPHKVQIVLQNVGFALLIILMLFVIYNDIISL
ncbi:MAG: RIP metalloprotease RseP [Ignavibacteriaceae bacterium]|nr:RIP metalloprotease RseP [Ignavibacteriaceae bacterium]